MMNSKPLLLTLKLTLTIAKAQFFLPAVPEPTNFPAPSLYPISLANVTTTIPTTASPSTLSPSRIAFQGQKTISPTSLPISLPISSPSSTSSPTFLASANFLMATETPTMLSMPIENNINNSMPIIFPTSIAEQQSSTPSIFPSVGLFTNSSNNVITKPSEYPSISPTIDESILGPAIIHPSLSPVVSMNPSNMSSYPPSASSSFVAPSKNDSWSFPSSNSTFPQSNQKYPLQSPTQSPSMKPSYPIVDAIAIPALTKFPSKSPSIASTTSIPTSKPTPRQPSNSPRTGFQVDPERSSGLSLQFIGIDEILDQRQWEKDTSAYIRSYFNDYELGPGRYGNDELRYAIFDVDATVKLMDQIPRNSVDGENAMARTSNGELNPPTVIVKYDQITTYKSSIQARIDLNYVLRAPFKTKASRYEYISYLQSASTDYENITFVNYIPKSDPRPPTAIVEEETSSDGGDSGPNWLVFGASIGAGVAFVVIVIGLVVIVRKKKHPFNNMVPVTNGSPSVHIDSDDMSSITGANSTHLPGTSENPEVVVNVIAPPGKLGVVVNTPPGGGPSYVCELRPGSVLEGQIRVGDKLIAVDAEDVQKMSALRVSKLLAGKSVNSQRNITVLREVRNGDSIL
mmetsp:Transcript_7590/g.15678  ORF Transcript_7590/g.15678 Transcript_7590/m.15678 type:complete len:628 (+) Transcript_7590:235-2118(+)